MYQWPMVYLGRFSVQLESAPAQRKQVYQHSAHCLTRCGTRGSSV